MTVGSRVCLADDCVRAPVAHGLCDPHYRRWRDGRESLPFDPGRSVTEKLWNFHRGEGGCWLWDGPLDYGGYARCTKLYGTWFAHRALYALLVEPVPEGLSLDHLCRVRHCVNPSHLEPVPQKENVRRGAQGVLKTHCVNGHPWVPENIRRVSTGNGHCRPCDRERARVYRARKARH